MMIKGTRQYDDELPSISVLIPAYNCGKYIQKTLMSIFDQKYDGRIEIVIGYDTKSTDDTLEKIQHIYSPYDIIIDSDNDSSIGAGRNRLMKFATGDYVLFMDSDDLITNTLFKNAIKLFEIKPELEIVSYGHKIVLEGKTDAYYKSHCNVENPKYEIMPSVDVMHAWWMSRKCAVCAWDYIYRRDFLINNDIVFPNYSHGEDQIFVLKSVLCTNKVGFLKMIGYVYRKHFDSTCNSERTPEQFFDEHSEYRRDYFDLCSDLYPAFYTIAYLDYVRWYVYRCSRLDYDVFLEKIADRHIKHIPVVFGTSIEHTGASIVFNISKRLFWLIARIRFKFVQ